MQIITMSLKAQNRIPIEATSINPDKLAGKTNDGIRSMLLWYGNEQCPLGDLFNVDVEGNDSAENTRIVINGDVSRVKRIGQDMRSGEIVINGNVDMHCGSNMKGGRIVINGNADSWLGCEMKGGEIILNGNGGYYVGGGYRGESCGMKGGRIIVNGNVLDYLGEHMCGGEIHVTGNAGLLPAIANNGGTITIEGDTEMPASDMKKGTVIIRGEVRDLLPSYRMDGSEEIDGAIYRRFIGDVNIGGKGVLLIKEV